MKAIETRKIPGATRPVLARAKGMVSRLVARSTETLLSPDAVRRLRVTREWNRWVDSLTADSLMDLTGASPDLKRRLFRAHVRRVEIETHAKCNRVCSFCPNAIIDRRLNETLMDGEVLDRIFKELGSIDYTGQIVVARYSEPLTNLPYLYETLTRARAAVPHAELSITTNTDYLTLKVLEKLHEIGLNTLYMSLYLRDRERWSVQLARTYTERIEKKLGIRAISKIETSTNLLGIYKYKGMRLSSTCHNWEVYGTDRGGSLAQYRLETRVGPCRDPFETFIVDYNGSVMPCCALRSDLPEHGNLVAGDLSVPGTSIFDIYAGQLSSWRRGLVGFGEKGFPCVTCRHRDLPVELVPAVSSRLKNHLDRIGRGGDYQPPLRQHRGNGLIAITRQ